jgi:choline-glycine betaine transporter
MLILASWIGNFLTDVGNRIEYSVVHMNLTQWGIFAIAALGLGVMAMRSRMPH